MCWSTLHSDVRQWTWVAKPELNLSHNSCDNRHASGVVVGQMAALYHHQSVYICRKLHYMAL